MKHIRKLFILLLASMLSLQLMAQEVEFTADRPGASTGTSVVGRNVVQWEQGVEYEGGEGNGSITFSNTLFRYGLFDRMELRLSGDGILYDDNGTFKPAFSGLTIGTKVQCYEGKGAIPAVAILAEFKIPKTGSYMYDTSNVAPSLYLLFDNPINETFSIGYNVGAEWDGESATPNVFLALCLGVAFNDRWGCFAESYNYIGENQFCADFGVNWMASKRVQLDLAANLDVCNPSNYWAVSFGVAWQINK